MPKASIKKGCWYIVDTLYKSVKFSYPVPRLYKHDYHTKEQAERDLQRLFPDTLDYDIISGEMAIYYKIPFRRVFPRMKQRQRRYEYPADRTTWREKKTMRNNIRDHNARKNRRKANGGKP